MLTLRGARERSLLDLDLDLHHGTWTAVTGPSGSGKTTLVHDTLVAEAQRRFVHTWSPRARRALGKVPRPALRSLDGARVPLSLGIGSEAANSRSTVGTRSGALAPLRVLFARRAVDPGGEALSVSHFSFAHPDGACPACQGLGEHDVVDPSLLVADPRRSLRDGALVPTLPNGYTVYSQVTPEVLDSLCRDHGFTLDTPWCELSAEQRHMIFHGTDVRKVPFGKHSLASRMRWKGITARPREEGYYRGLVPVIEETLKRNRTANILRFVRTERCPECDGTRLGRPGRQARWQGHTLPSLLALPAAELRRALVESDDEVARALLPSVWDRCDRMVQLGLGHLALARPLATLSGGEAQRLGLVARLGTELSGLLLAVDEPTLGLHPSAQQGLREALEHLRALGNTVVSVEHDPDFVRHADRVVSMGPSGGAGGGRIVADGPPVGDPLGPPPDPPATPPEPEGTMWLRGARLHGLRGVDYPVHLRRLQVVLGPSGAGKSSLVFGTLLPALTGAAAGPHDGLQGVPEGLEVVAVDSKPLGRTPRSTPATWTGWFDAVRKHFARTDAAKALGWGAGAFAYNNKQGRCEACEGLGTERVRLHLFDDVLRTCSACDGLRYGPQLAQVRWRDRSIAEVLQLTAEQAAAWLGDHPLADLPRALCQLGLGYLPLGRPSPSLSRGEGQRVKLAALLAARRDRPTLVLLDEPDRGLHPVDLQRLIAALRGLVAAGHTVVAISHHRHLWAAADHRVGLHEGHLQLEPELVEGPLSQPAPARSPASMPATIELRGVRTHHLRGFDLSLPHRALVAIVGVSGSGKSSLAVHTLAAEARRRLAESLPFEARRHLRQLPVPQLDAATGLTPTVWLEQRRSDGGGTLATLAGLSEPLRLLWSRQGTLDGRPADLSAEHFSRYRPAGACPACGGRRRVPRCDHDALVTHPDRPLGQGALQGTRVGRFLEEPHGQHLATLHAAVRAAGLSPDPLAGPWTLLPAELQELALHGSEAPLDVRWSFQRGGRTGEHRFQGRWEGLLALAEAEAGKRAAHRNAAEWAEPLRDLPCDACDATGLQAPARDVRVGGRTLPSLYRLPLHEVAAFLDTLTDPVAQAIVAQLRPALQALRQVGLQHPLGTSARDLDASEHQRVRLASVTHSGLTGLTLVLDEPTAALARGERVAVAERLRALVDAGQTVVVVTHDPVLIRAADHLVELGGGAGPAGGRLLASGPRDQVLAGDTPTARALRRTPPPVPERVHVGLPEEPGVFRVAAPDAEAWMQAWLQQVEHGRHPRFVRAVRPSLPAHDTLLDTVGALGAMQKLFAGAGDLPRKAFSFRSPAGRCPACKGRGRAAIGLELFRTLTVPCPQCEGARYRPEVLQVEVGGRSVDAWLDTPVATLRDEGLPPALDEAFGALCTVGLGGQPPGRELSTLSGGERTRATLARTLARDDPDGALVATVHPTWGLHPDDVPALAEGLRSLADRGALVLCHDPSEALDPYVDGLVAAGSTG
jgi:excinuclease ABC subunit A